MHGVLIADIFGPDIVVVVLLAVVLLFGGSQLPKLARSLGSASHEFKKAVEEGGKADQPEQNSNSNNSNSNTDSSNNKTE
ncbi:MAG: twin-arginine translocase TatA/TatE family subunit [Actinobacteria bacterium]|nr:twin-arginine translocase TatA/TatE family subunit [Actinomycetota bacterium]MCL5445895.1 twin-arginine translocase TatA/TatE family subunit [Actinomycetota bacterium]